MTTFVVFVVCSVRSSTANCSGWTQNLIRKHRGNVKNYRDSSLFSQEYAKELFEAQGNIIYKDISRKPKAPQDLISMASVLGKLKTNLCYLCDENHAMDTCAIQWRTGKCLPVKKIFWVLFSTIVSKIQFFCAGCYFKNQPWLHRTARTSIYQRNAQELTNKRTAIKDLFVFWTFKRTSLDLNWFYRSPGR